jgi:hypothetical protein
MLSQGKYIEILVHLISGGIGGGVSTTITYPFTNIRLRKIAEY